jgi:hypothetical protein
MVMDDLDEEQVDCRLSSIKRLAFRPQFEYDEGGFVNTIMEGL